MPYTEEHVAAVRDFNRRLGAGGRTDRFPESPVPEWLPRREGVPLHQEFYVAVDGGAVRGGYVLKPQLFAVDTMIADYRAPLSEGIVDRRYGMVGLLLLKDALKRCPLMFGLGMGGAEEPIARLFGLLKWKMVPCPFYFRVVRPFRFLRQITFLRRRASRRALMDALAFSGAGWVIIKAMQSWKARRATAPADLTAHEVADFGPWCDSIWEEAKGAYSLIAVRDRRVLQALYPGESERYTRLKMVRDGRPVGWAVVLNTQMQQHKHFGDMRVGTLADCLAEPGEEPSVVALAARHLALRGADIIVTNQLHTAWCQALEISGFLSGPSNFLFAASPALAERIAPYDENVARAHMTRGDGDGPYNL